jgi:hypothetical protein
MPRAGEGPKHTLWFRNPMLDAYGVPATNVCPIDLENGFVTTYTIP